MFIRKRAQTNLFSLLLLLISIVSYASPSVYEYKLSNGFKLLVKPDHRASVVFSSIWYKVGGSYEHNGTTGISHMLEHMMFRGTRQYGPGVLEKLVSQVGGQQNAITSNDYTVYYQVLPADKLSLSVRLEADRMHNLLLNPVDFKKEQQVVMEERRMRFEDNPQALLWERVLAAAFVNNPYHHQAIGWMTDIKHLTVKNLRQWYETWYQPNNAFFVVVGDVDPLSVKSLVEKYFGPLKGKLVPTLKPRVEVKSLGRVDVQVIRPAKLPLLMLGFHTPTLTTTTNKIDPYALDVLSTLLGGSASSRLDNILVREQAVASSIQVDYDPFNLHSNLLQLFAIPVQGQGIKALEKKILVEIAKLKTTSISQEELSRIKAQLVSAKVFAQDSVQTQGMILGVPMAIGLPWSLGENYLAGISQVTPEDVQRVAKKYLHSQAMTAGYLYPQQTGVNAHAKTH